MAMGSICPQCNVTVQPGQVVCMNCGSHLHAVPAPSKMGAGKLIAMIAGGVVILAGVFAGVIWLKDKSGTGGSGGASQFSEDNRRKCMNNCSQIYKAMLAFAQDNGERLPWQLTPSGVRNHLDANSAPGTSFGLQMNRDYNEVIAHNNALQTAGVWGLLAVKRELITPKILLSPCDPARAGQNERVQENWNSYNTKANGVSAELGGGTSYTLIRGADTSRPSSVLVITRNWSGNGLGSGRWLGPKADKGNGRVMDGLKDGNGQMVQMDGSAKMAAGKDVGPDGQVTRAARQATGGKSKGQTSLNILRGAGL